MFSLDGGANWISKRAGKNTRKVDQLWMAYTEDEKPEIVIYRRFELPLIRSIDS